MSVFVLHRATALLGLWLVAFASQAQLVTQTLWEALAPRSANASLAGYDRLFFHQGR